MAANQGVLNQGAINPLNAAPAEVSGYKSKGQSEERNVITGVRKGQDTPAVICSPILDTILKPKFPHSDCSVAVRVWKQACHCPVHQPFG